MDSSIYHLPHNLNEFQYEMYVHLINYKWSHITKEPGYFKGRPYDAILPDNYKSQHYPICRGIVQKFLSHQENFKFKSHKFIGHMASSQAACANLFLPILLQKPETAAEILRTVKPDLDRIAAKLNGFDQGFRFEFWDSPEGILKDHNGMTGTDADIAIAYYDRNNQLNLWLIEHKLTEKEFTTCGGYRSKGKIPWFHDCSSIKNILENPKLCYYHSNCGYRYWDITLKNPHFFREVLSTFKECPFQSGLNQLWRNQLLALGIETSQNSNYPFTKVYFSVVYHPSNKYLEPSLIEFKKLVNHTGRFSYFPSDKLIATAEKIHDPSSDKWLHWYKELYYF